MSSGQITQERVVWVKPGQVPSLPKGGYAIAQQSPQANGNFVAYTVSGGRRLILNITQVDLPRPLGS